MNIIEIKEEVEIGGVILEAGDRIKVLNEKSPVFIYFDLKDIQDLPRISEEFGEIISDLKADYWFRVADSQGKKDIFWVISTREESRTQYWFENGKFILVSQGMLFKI